MQFPDFIIVYPHSLYSLILRFICYFCIHLSTYVVLYTSVSTVSSSGPSALQKLPILSTSLPKGKSVICILWRKQLELKRLSHLPETTWLATAEGLGWHRLQPPEPSLLPRYPLVASGRSQKAGPSEGKQALCPTGGEQVNWEREEVAGISSEQFPLRVKGPVHSTRKTGGKMSRIIGVAVGSLTQTAERWGGLDRMTPIC